jgi:Restriction endonuclease
MPFPHRKIARRLLEGDNAVVAEEIGAALEDVVSWTLCSLPGVRILHRDFVNRANSTEIDLFLFNNPRLSPIEFLPQFLIVECKNWRAPVNSATIRDFITKVRSARQEVGILVAANGITGDAADQTAANDDIRLAFDQDGTKILVLTRVEIEQLRSLREIVLLLQEKYGKACLRSTII